jgi:hypothetical protein
MTVDDEKSKIYFAPLSFAAREIGKAWNGNKTLARRLSSHHGAQHVHPIAIVYDFLFPPIHAMEAVAAAAAERVNYAIQSLSLSFRASVCVYQSTYTHTHNIVSGIHGTSSFYAFRSLSSKKKRVHINCVCVHCSEPVRYKYIGMHKHKFMWLILISTPKTARARWISHACTSLFLKKKINNVEKFVCYPAAAAALFLCGYKFCCLCVFYSLCCWRCLLNKNGHVRAGRCCSRM